jgi:hypothetical protein
MTIESTATAIIDGIITTIKILRYSDGKRSKRFYQKGRLTDVIILEPEKPT